MYEFHSLETLVSYMYCTCIVCKLNTTNLYDVECSYMYGLVQLTCLITCPSSICMALENKEHHLSTLWDTRLTSGLAMERSSTAVLVGETLMLKLWIIFSQSFICNTNLHVNNDTSICNIYLCTSTCTCMSTCIDVLKYDVGNAELWLKKSDFF